MPSLPDSLVSLLDGQRLADKIGHTFLLLVNDEEQWPHAAMLSVGEVHAPDRLHVNLALYANSGTSRALRHSKRAVLLAVLDGSAVKVYLEANETASPVPDRRNRYFVGRVRKVVVDAVGYATVLHGIGYALDSPADVVPRWESTVQNLHSLTLPE